ncbi:MAG: helix-turn-helix transcriptional regulator [Muribaculaceae bacterium]|nr:helix-turn-helix transcriptional regulator [Muribaculaceae bacterium]
MDIASRLRQYMEAKEIASSQFADTAEIPRPTLSQLLNGRNKKISNELIGKIHDADVWRGRDGNSCKY